MRPSATTNAGYGYGDLRLSPARAPSRRRTRSLVSDSLGARLIAPSEAVVGPSAGWSSRQRTSARGARKRCDRHRPVMPSKAVKPSGSGPVGTRASHGHRNLRAVVYSSVLPYGFKEVRYDVGDRSSDDHEVEPQRPVLDVVVVEAGPILDGGVPP